jgi:hypothetical protein
MVQLIEFESKDPAFASPMTIKWSLADVPGGTEFTVLCENAPEGIRPDEHEAGIRSTLESRIVSRSIAGSLDHSRRVILCSAVVREVLLGRRVLGG